MNSKPYKIIFTLLSFSLLAVLLLQGFWIRNFYSQKLDEFNTAVYQTLSDISNKLNERENLDFIKHAAFPKTQTKITKKDGTVKVVVSASNTTSNVGSVNDIDILKELSLDTVFSEKQQIIISDSVMHMHNGHQTITINKKSNKHIPKKEEIDKLIDKMMTEIKTIDVSPIEDINEDTLNNLIKRELETKGIFIPFEFLLKKVDQNTDEILAQSKGFKKENKVYKADLSNNKVFRDHNFLYLQFPDETGFVFLRMKNMLLLAALFSLIIIVVFYVTLKTILKQKKLGEIKNDFINNMTHELKTPIATISLAIDAINNPQVKNDDERFNRYTAILKEENQKLNSHVERVLQMAMLDKGELQLHKIPVNLIATIRSAINTHELQIAKQKAQVVFNPQQTELMIVGDEYHLLTVFNNLLDNALKYSNENCLIEISVNKTINDLTISFKDNGIGIEIGLHQKVFEKFYRVHGGNLHDIKGFGLGLSYVKSIIERHNGSVELKSTKGKGSEFIIKLPII